MNFLRVDAQTDFSWRRDAGANPSDDMGAPRLLAAGMQVRSFPGTRHDKNAKRRNAPGRLQCHHNTGVLDA